MKTPNDSLRPRIWTAALAFVLAAAPAAAAPKVQKTAAPADKSADPEGAKLPPVLPGWDSCKWNDPLHQTPKYVVGRIVARHAHTPNGLKEALPEIAEAYPGSAITRAHGDKVDIPCVGVIDMVVNSGGAEYPDSGDSWSWQVVEDKCGACDPNRCEAVSKSVKCAAPAAAGGGGGGGTVNSGRSSGSGGVAGGAAGAGGGGRPHPDQSAAVAQAKEDLESAGHDLSGPCGAFAIVKLAAWRLKDEGAGLLSKPSGNNCDGYATDIIAYPDGRIYDVLVGAGESNGPAWQDDGTVDASRYRPPEDPGL